jgi:hypothetical protein
MCRISFAAQQAVKTLGVFVSVKQKHTITMLCFRPGSSSLHLLVILASSAIVARRAKIPVHWRTSCANRHPSRISLLAKSVLLNLGYSASTGFENGKAEPQRIPVSPVKRRNLSQEQLFLCPLLSSCQGSLTEEL